MCDAGVAGVTGVGAVAVLDSPVKPPSPVLGSPVAAAEPGPSPHSRPPRAAAEPRSPGSGIPGAAGPASHRTVTVIPTHASTPRTPDPKRAHGAGTPRVGPHQLPRTLKPPQFRVEGSEPGSPGPQTPRPRNQGGLLRGCSLPELHYPCLSTPVAHFTPPPAAPAPLYPHNWVISNN